MNKQALKQLIQESIREVMSEMGANERIQDPTREEMLQYLQSQYGNEEGFEDSAEIAMYWFANFNHGGQSSNLYSVLSTSPFRPGPISRGPEPESMEEIMYQSLEDEFGGGQGSGDVDEMTTTGAVAGYMTPNAFKKNKNLKEVGEEDPNDPLYVEYVKELPGEEPFMMNGQKFQYVLAKYPNGKTDIGVYAFAGDMVHGYNAFRRMHNIKEEEQPEPYDSETDTFAPGPRSRPEDWSKSGEQPSSTLSQDIVEGYVLDWILQKLESESDPRKKDALQIVRSMI